MIEITVRCGCTRPMSPDGRTGPGVYRCGCGASVRLSGLPTADAKRCRMMQGARTCNGPKLPDRPACEPCMIKVADEALRTPDLAEQLGDQRGVTDFKLRRAERDRELMEAFTTWVRPDRRPDAPKCGVVYYAELRPGIVKIGTTMDLHSRMSVLHVPPAAVLAAEPGTYDAEKARHRQFADTRIGKREDFIVDDALRSHINQLAAEHGDPFELQTRLWREHQELAQDPTSELSSAKVG